MKKLFQTLFIAALLTVFALTGAGCASPSSSAKSDVSAPALSPSMSDKQSAEASSGLTGGPNASPETSAAKDFGTLGWALLSNDGLGYLKLGLSAGDLVKLMGQPDIKSDAQIWEADGNEHSDWSYTSKGLELNMVKQPDDTEATIYSITAEPPCSLATKRGISIGDTREAVLKAYANEYDPDSGSEDIVLGTIYGGIMIHLEDGVVATIFIGAAAE